MSYLNKTRLSEPERDAYEQWYLGIDESHTDQFFSQDLWYPRLCRLSYDADDKRDEATLLETVIGIGSDAAYALDQKSQKSPQDRTLLLTDHDALHAFIQLVDPENNTADLLVFAKGGLSNGQLMEQLNAGLSAVLRGLSVDVVAVGAPSREPVQGAARDNDATEAVVSSRREPRSITVPGFSPPTAPIFGVIIDHALGFANKVFCNRTASGGLETRFHRVWTQDQFHNMPATSIGAQLSKATIDAALQANAATRYATEVDIYTDLNVIPPDVDFPPGGAGQLRSATHGTQVAHVAFGADPDDASDPMGSVPLLGIQLPAASVERTHGLLHDLYLKSALNWVWLQGIIYAFTQGTPYPRFFVNHSFGTYAGRPDGFDEISADFDRRLSRGELDVVTAAAGNSFQTATHARLTQDHCGASGEEVLELNIQPDNKATTFVRVWADHAAAAPVGSDTFPMGLVLETPDGTSFALDPATGGAFEVGHSYDALLNGVLLGRIFVQKLGANSLATQGAPDMRVITLAIPPTADTHSQATAIPHGKWRLRCTWNDPLYDDTLGLWIERGDTPDGFRPRSRQSYFTHPAEQRRDVEGRLRREDVDASPIKKFGTLSASGASEHALVVASYRARDNEMSAFSSASSPLLVTRMFGADTLPRQPRLAAASEMSTARPTLLMTGTVSGSVSAARGTSISAPFVLRQTLLSALMGSTTPVDDVLATLTPAGTDDSPFRLGVGRLPGSFEAIADRYSTF